MDFFVSHYAFKNLKVTIPINWNIDPYKNKNWVLHFMSFRWMERFSIGDQLILVKDYFDFFYVKKNRDTYIKTLRGDHAAAIRLSFLINLASKQTGENKFFLRELIQKEILNALDDKMYRAGHNHALMLDNSLLDCYLYDKTLLTLSNLNLVVSRGVSTAKKLYCDSGITREHSVSYQEYNLPILFEFFKKIKDIDGVLDDAIDYMNSVSFNSLFILSAMLNSKGEYFAIGDTLRPTKPKIIKKVFGDENALNSFSKNMYGIYCNGGFFVFKKLVGDKLLHFVSTCQWNSYNHKQDDELSFCLEYNGNLIFDDPGYSGFLSLDQQAIIYSRKGHSTFFIEELEWVSKTSSPFGSVIDHSAFDEHGFELSASHQRQLPNNKCTRSFKLFEKNLLVRDTFTNLDSLFEKTATHRFVLNPKIKVNVYGDLVHLMISDRVIATIENLLAKDDGKWNVVKIPYVESDSRVITSTVCLDFSYTLKSNTVEFLINLLD
ncbi:heparinase II/III family protein [Acinetobacter sp. HR7]|uniref:heparinase II/III domain-containing protein n=1 Tax=Acinetobacter sp. HR7 TaxID=1509403 RepID=UPI0005365959|nr:heparinase II/III family protein [Acinetobacter sp. HR7]KGT46203.1 hypothetical protein GW12_27480 [Acinetobacter sp. HR7]